MPAVTGVSGRRYSERTGQQVPPPRGKPYVDARSGRKMILPREGGRAVPYIEAPAEPFSAQRALRRAGIRAAGKGVAAGDRAAAGAPAATARALERSGGLPDLGTSGFGGLLLYGFATIVTLALLENALSGRGPAGVQTILDALGGGIRKLVDPSDPIVSRGIAPAATASATSSGTAGKARAGGYVNPFSFGFTVGRTDQGLDLEAGAQNVGKPIGAIGDAQIVAVDRNYAGFGQYVAYKLLSGPQAGKVIFIGHSQVADVTVGQKVQAGAPVAYVKGYNAQPGHLEIGYASPTDPYTTLARALGHVDPTSHFSAEGAAFASWFLGLFGKGG